MAKHHLHLPIKELDLRIGHTNLTTVGTIVDRTMNAVPGFKTSAGQFDSFGIFFYGIFFASLFPCLFLLQQSLF